MAGKTQKKVTILMVMEELMMRPRKRTRLDRGGEFTSKEFKTYYKSMAFNIFL